MEKISVVVPVYNSRKTLEVLCYRLKETFKRLSLEYEIILVDDGSKDNSFSKMMEIHSKDPEVKIIQLKRNFGQQNALMCGLHYVTGTYAVIMDDDLQNPPEEIIKLWSKIREGYDIVYGLPPLNIKKEQGYRYWGGILRDLLFNLMINKPPQIKVSTFRIVHRDLVNKIIKDQTSFVYISAIIFKHKVKAANIEVEHHKREVGRSNYSMLQLAQLYLKILLNYGPVFFKFARTSRPQYEIAQIQGKGLL
ncbi:MULTISPECIES: glycosyltransferase family 2 protein [Desulfitobacterium]|uniref:Glycosyl transferase n=1 Tax=Desulfitobacterium dehalogenans (strain ATCC 51507 / DSM 9161 / JW/IU-DC1) TaxID=756499 RepID=I4A415_DESDJ|nr:MULTISPECIES: glycosyltransferase family 2 protein [Desulfitobacterium]AFL98699.1 glycosyl transferase [Desulfitobacterium dehalogenans ATCC 51507]